MRTFAVLLGFLLAVAAFVLWSLGTASAAEGRRVPASTPVAAAPAGVEILMSVR
jgi:hypothetical protein